MATTLSRHPNWGRPSGGKQRRRLRGWRIWLASVRLLATCRTGATVTVLDKIDEWVKPTKTET